MKSHSQNKPVPDFAIFQNSRTRMSAVWAKEQGEWVVASKDEYGALKILAEIIRNSNNASAMLEGLVNQIHKIRRDEEKD